MGIVSSTMGEKRRRATPSSFYGSRVDQDLEHVYSIPEVVWDVPQPCGRPAQLAVHRPISRRTLHSESLLNLALAIYRHHFEPVTGPQELISRQEGIETGRPRSGSIRRPIRAQAGRRDVPTHCYAVYDTSMTPCYKAREYNLSFSTEKNDGLDSQGIYIMSRVALHRPQLTFSNGRGSEESFSEL